MAIQLDTTVARRGGVLAAPIDNEVVMLSMTTENYLALDPIGRRIWDLLDEPRRVDALCAELSVSFATPIERIQTDVLPFLEELASEGVLDATPA